MTAPEEWAKGFYTGLSAKVWMALGESRTGPEVDFIETALDLPAGARILDLACGWGRHSIELAARGYVMTGVDASDGLLAAARAAAAERGLEVTFEERALGGLSWESAFDGAVCMGNSLWCLDDGGLEDILRGVARTLKPGARFLLNTEFLAESLFPNLKVRDWIQVGEILALAHRCYDPIEGRLDIEFTFVRGHEVEKRAGFGLVYTYREFCRLVEGAGFRVLEAYASATCEPYHFGAPQLLLLAEKWEA